MPRSTCAPLRARCRGDVADGLAVFRGIPFAAPAGGRTAVRSARGRRALDGRRSMPTGSARGAPQNPSVLEQMLGGAEVGLVARTACA